MTLRKAIVGGLVVLFFLPLVATVVVPPWLFLIEPWLRNRDLNAAADAARSWPYVTSADVRLDWLDGDTLAVHFDPDVDAGITGDEAMRLWCEVLLGIAEDPDGAGPWIEVYRGQFTAIPPPRVCPADGVP
jgi:hypothetical protein